MIGDSFLKSFRETKSPFITNPYRFAAAGVGGWVEVGRHALPSVGDIINVTSIPDKRYYMILMDGKGSNLNGLLYLGSGSADTAQNYAMRTSLDGGTDTAWASQYQIFNDGVGSNVGNYTVGYIANLSGKEKLGIFHTIHQNTAGAGNAPQRVEHVGKWTNTANPIDYMRLHNYGGGSYDAGAEMVVLGWDPDDTHTTNFWEELASVELGSAADTISSGTITAKKYLWVQFYQKSSGACNMNMTFNNDSGSNYSRRGSNDGGTDFTSTSSSSLAFQAGATDSAHFFNMFIVNNSSNEKLGISHGITRNAAGSGTAPSRKEQVHKWANTSSQITEIDIDNTDSGSYDTGTLLKVWGSN